MTLIRYKICRLDYVEIVNPYKFKPLQGQADKEKAIAVMAVFLGE